MKNRKAETSASLARRLTQLNASEVDLLYGLEPVYEPAQNALPGLRPDEFVSIRCPWCGERLETHVDLTEGAVTSIEDCQVCCRPMELSVELEDNGALKAVKVQRLD
jgi:hypothetical protein